MKPNRYERSCSDTVPPPQGLVRIQSNKTGLGKTQGKIHLNCDLCGLSYETYACWAKRTKHHYCSRACANAAKEIKVTARCVVCGAVYDVIPTNVARVVTCSRACLRKRRRALMLDGGAAVLTQKRKAKQKKGH